jgi:AcrR family transcriptional regulator
MAEPALEARREPTQSRSRNTVARIREAAAWIIETEGLPRLNSNRIAEVAKVSVGTLYKFFPNKQAILASVVAEWNAERERSITEIARLNPSASLSEQIEDWFRYFVETPAAHVLMTARALQFYPELNVVDEAYKARSVNLIVEALRRDGCTLDPPALQRVAASIHDLGLYLLSRVIEMKGERREAQLVWSLMLMRAAIADAMGQCGTAKSARRGRPRAKSQAAIARSISQLHDSSRRHLRC